MTGQRNTPARSRRVRLDELLVSRGLAASPEKARSLVLAGEVEIHGPVNGTPTPGTLVSPGIEISVRAGLSFVGRGGEKLAGALQAFRVDPTGLTAVDVGASTGGFTDCLLQQGASHVYAIDVGHGQLAWQLRQDPRVVVMEGVNARFPLPVDDEQFALATVDVSFISLTLVLRNVVNALVAGGRLITLVKPQFEAARADVKRGGVVRDPRVRAAAVGKVCLAGLELGLRVRGVAGSSIAGPKGNREVFALFEKE